MNTYVTGAAIKSLRERQKLTQAMLAEKLCVSDKTISKWETGKGYPDISLLEPLAAALRVSVAELLSGSTVTNTNVSANMRRSHFYVCPVCGNVIHSMGQAAISCHGITLPPLEPETVDAAHPAVVQTVEDEYYLSIPHEMRRDHYISFLAAVSGDRLQLVKLYPEGSAEARFQKSCVDAFYFYCSKDGLFRIPAR